MTPGEPLATDPTAVPQLPRNLRRAVIVRLVFFLVTLVTLYILAPSLLAVFSAFPKLLKINPAWFPVVLALEAASFLSAWALQRLALRTKSWFGVGTAHLTGNAVSRVVPGGGAAGGAVQYRMLVQSGVDPAQVAAGLTAAGLISTGTLLLLPVLSLPALVAGRPVPNGLAQAAWLGLGVFIVAFAAGVVLVRSDGSLRAVGRAVGWITHHVRPGHDRDHPPVVSDLPDRLIRERDAVVDVLGKRWWVAFLASLGNWLFDYLALLAVLTAVGAHPRPTLVLLAYAGSMVLGMIPITPGGLGFVEAGLVGLLALAGVAAAVASIAVLAYRLVSYWLPLPAGAVAAVLHRRRYAAVRQR
ncbi:MAG: glycosyltransferase 2 family protein [Actinomycetota bacterium]|jgi:uncharacterized protein (TIRG00374 family)|nr:glycosyltransferase 2 family protein [Actinomycetota bacterium]